MKPIFLEKFLVNFYDENNNKINEEPIEYHGYPPYDVIAIDMDYYRCNAPHFVETKWYDVKKITCVRWVDEDE